MVNSSLAAKNKDLLRAENESFFDMGIGSKGVTNE